LLHVSGFLEQPCFDGLRLLGDAGKISHGWKAEGSQIGWAEA
jgi:hypothetical protein